MTNAYNIQLDGPVLAIDDDAEYRKELEEILTRHNLPYQLIRRIQELYPKSTIPIIVV